MSAGPEVLMIGAILIFGLFFIALAYMLVAMPVTAFCGSPGFLN